MKYNTIYFIQVVPKIKDSFCLKMSSLSQYILRIQMYLRKLVSKKRASDRIKNIPP